VHTKQSVRDVTGQARNRTINISVAACPHTLNVLVGFPGQDGKGNMAYYTADFLTWWHNTGSGIGPEKNDDMESHAHRVAHAAWDAACLSTIMLLAKDGSTEAHRKPNASLEPLARKD